MFDVRVVRTPTNAKMVVTKLPQRLKTAEIPMTSVKQVDTNEMM